MLKLFEKTQIGSMKLKNRIVMGLWEQQEKLMDHTV